MFGGPNHMAVLPELKLDAEFYRHGLAQIYA
jgi:hypothetical protein